MDLFGLKTVAIAENCVHIVYVPIVLYLKLTHQFYLEYDFICVTMLPCIVMLHWRSCTTGKDTADTFNFAF